MQQLRLSGTTEDGRHVVLVDDQGTEFVLDVDERLRAALRRPPDAGGVPTGQATPRHVQAMIRAGHDVEEVAGLTGWPRERVERFEVPIAAERRHVVGMAQLAHVRGRGPGGKAQTLEGRVRERLGARGVEEQSVHWDSTRPEGGDWTVVVSFLAGSRHRSASWQFEPAGRTVEALDDEARWLSEDEMALPGSAASGALLGGGEASESVDLMATMRERSRARGRRGRRVSTGASGGGETATVTEGTGSTDPAAVPGVGQVPDDVLPLEDLRYDPDSMGLPPAAHGYPADDAVPQATPADLGTDNLVDDDLRDDDLGKDDVGKDSFGDQPPDDAERHDGVSGAVPQGQDEDDQDDSEHLDDDGDEDDEDDDSPHQATLADLFQDDDEGADDDEDDEGADDEDGEDHEDDEGHEDRPTEDHAPAPSVDEDASGATPRDEPVVTADKRPKRKARPSVPSWDDIMFGARDR